MADTGMLMQCVITYEFLFADFEDAAVSEACLMSPRLSPLALLHREDRQKVENYVEDVVPLYLLDDFKLFFRVSRQTMEILCQHLSGEQKLRRREPAAGRPQTTLEKDVLMTLWFIGSQETMKSVADRFNVSISTFDNHFKRMVTVICDSLLKRLIKWPSEAEKPIVINAFQVKKNFPGVLGSIDGCHIKIGKPTERANDYYNRKGFYSVVLQAVCREDRRFTDIYCGWPGKVHDARVFRNSPLSERLQVLCGCNHLLGDGAYPLSGNLLTPYRDNGHLNRAQKNYNTCLSSTRVLIENAFGTLKNRFRRLKCIELKDITYIVKTIVSACIIHNFCILNQDEMPDEEDDQENCDDGNVNLDVNANGQGIMKRQIITQNLALQNN